MIDPELIAILEQIPAAITKAIVDVYKGYPNHAGRPGKVGGSVPKGGGGPATIGVHVKKLLGDKAAAGAYLGEIDALDKTFDGGVTGFLEKHPIGSIYVGLNSDMAGGGGLYTPGLQKVSVKPSKRFVSPDWIDEDDTVSAWHGVKKNSTEAMAQATFIHELGHHIGLTVIDKSPGGPDGMFKQNFIIPFQNDKKKVSNYSDTDPHEYFAESFTAYHLYPKRLSPTAKKMVEAVMKRAGEI